MILLIRVLLLKTEEDSTRDQVDNITIEHQYQVDIFYVAIDSQLQELNTRFSEEIVEFLQLSTSLLPNNAYSFFNSILIIFAIL